MITMRTTTLAAVAATAVLASLPAVAQADTPPPGDIPDNQAFVTYRAAGYALKVPEGWRRTQKKASVTFSDKYNSIQVVASRAATRPTVRSATRFELVRLRRRVRGFAQPKVASVRRPAGAVVLITYRATSAPNAVTGKAVTNDVERYEFWKAGKLVVLTLQAPRGSDNVDPWKIVTDSVALTP